MLDDVGIVGIVGLMVAVDVSIVVSVAVAITPCLKLGEEYFDKLSVSFS